MRKLLLLLALGFALGPLAVSTRAKELTKLTIVVTNDSGKPVERANVLVKFGGRSIAKFGKTVRTTWEMRSTEEGVAEVPEMPKGKILVQVTAKGFQTFGQTFDVSEDERTIEVKLNPPQEQYTANPVPRH
jgi:hypothetical protein